MELFFVSKVKNWKKNVYSSGELHSEILGKMLIVLVDVLMTAFPKTPPCRKSGFYQKLWCGRWLLARALKWHICTEKNKLRECADFMESKMLKYGSWSLTVSTLLCMMGRLVTKISGFSLPIMVKCCRGWFGRTGSNKCSRPPWKNHNVW